MENSRLEAYTNPLAEIFPLKKNPLVQCITNEITCESVANALLYIGAKPVMADDPREFADFFKQNDSLLLNLGHLSPEREANLLAAAAFSEKTETPMVIDLVGVSASQLRYDLAWQLMVHQPQIVKGNISELRRFCQLTSHGRGVDGSQLDQEMAALQELAAALQKVAQDYPETIFLATGVQDLLVTTKECLLLKNGVWQLDNFTGTGDIVGALAAAFLGSERSIMAALAAVTYFNLCGEAASQTLRAPQALADFRQETLNQLALLKEQPLWFEKLKGSVL
ncbi:hydroxyethylthiazole kinase [Enterococcus sp. HY326]|uniref:hydroxyethylthiazole kinase n=1 Tax=Enterococcus sp. HY326 TaxID=2971265 RepID=UPI00223F2C2A|nr:hydroxyethylthiazole kinase [Enterococcus sp. HY326]